MVAHPDHLTPTGLNSYTYVSRGALKKLLPTCQQPSAKQLAAAKAFQQKQQDLYNANVQKAEQQMKAPRRWQTSPADAAKSRPPKNAEERAMRRCVSSGRLPVQLHRQLAARHVQRDALVRSAIARVQAALGRTRSWPASFRAPGLAARLHRRRRPGQLLLPLAQPGSYSLKFEANRTALIINTRPRPLDLTFHPDGTITGPGPVTIQGVVAGGYTPGTSTPGHTETQSYNTTERMNQT